MIPTRLLLLLMLLPSVVHTDAHPIFVARIPNGDNVGQVHALGHIAWDGDGPRNEFGKAFEAAGFQWTRSLCKGDADADGQSNGEELGDPCCTWSADSGKPPLITDVLSHPGDLGRKLNATDLRSRQLICETMEASAGSFSSSSSGTGKSSSAAVTSPPRSEELQTGSPPVPSPANLPTPSSLTTSLRRGHTLFVAVVVFVFAILVV